MPWPLASRVAAALTELAHTGSTNADLAERAGRESIDHLTVLLTRDQRSGRGRLDRTWTAPAGAALAVSVLVRVGDVPPAARGWIPLIAGVAMTRAVGAQLPGHEVRAKWPNDVLVDGRKICGILAQGVASDIGGTDGVVVGSGVNTAMTAEQLPVPTATSFAALGSGCDEDRLLSDYLETLCALLADLARAAGDAETSGVRSAVIASCATLGQEVAVSLPDGTSLRGTAETLDAEGRLIVRSGAALVPVSAGDVVHVRPA